MVILLTTLSVGIEGYRSHTFPGCIKGFKPGTTGEVQNKRIAMIMMISIVNKSFLCPDSGDRAGS